MSNNNLLAALRDHQRRADAALFQMLTGAADGGAPRAEALRSFQANSKSVRETLAMCSRKRDELTIRVSEGVTVHVTVRKDLIPTSTINLISIRDTPDAVLVSYTIKSHGGARPGPRLRLTSVVEGYSAHAITTVEHAGNQTVSQMPTFYKDRIKTVKEVTPATLRVRVDSIEGGVEKIVAEQTFTLLMLARDTSYAFKEDANGELQLWLDGLAVFVTPSAPAVHTVLREAAERGPIAGLLSPDPTVDPQVKAIYDALKARKIAYINTLEALGPPAGYAQRVRLPRETLSERAASCVDATVLFASAIEAAWIKAAIVFLDNHTLVAWKSTPASETWEYLETTAISIDLDCSFKVARDLGADLVRASSSVLVRSLDDLREAGIYPME